MSEAAREEREEAAGGPVGRVLHAVELLASAHASRAKDEAKRDLSRLVGGAALLLAAIFLAVPALVLFDFALAMTISERTSWSVPGSLALVACFDTILVVALALAARARFSPPVLAETRATLKRAAIVLRG